jgi:hypothetical protein
MARYRKYRLQSVALIAGKSTRAVMENTTTTCRSSSSLTKKWSRGAQKSEIASRNSEIVRVGVHGNAWANPSYQAITREGKTPARQKGQRPDYYNSI